MRVMLDIYDDIVPPDEKDADKPKEEEEGDDVDAVEKEKQKPTPPVLSVEDALKSEIESIKEDDKIENKKFKIVDLDMKACIFVLMSKDAASKADPSEMVVRYLSEVKETSRTRSRFVERILPVQEMCAEACARSLPSFARDLLAR